MRLRNCIDGSVCVEAFLVLVLTGLATGCGKSPEPDAGMLANGGAQVPGTRDDQSAAPSAELPVGALPPTSSDAAPADAPGKAGQLPATLTLHKRRPERGGYGDAAYSFLHMSQDVKVHHNTVDLVYESCGALHLSFAGRANRVAVLGESKLADVTTVPDQAWKKTTELGFIVPRPGDVYVLHVIDTNDRKTPFYVKIKVSKVSPDTVDLECAFLNEDSASKFRAIRFTRGELLRGVSGASAPCSFDESQDGPGGHPEPREREQ